MKQTLEFYLKNAKPNGYSDGDMTFKDGETRFKFQNHAINSSIVGITLLQKEKGDKKYKPVAEFAMTKSTVMELNEFWLEKFGRKYMSYYLEIFSL